MSSFIKPLNFSRYYTKPAPQIPQQLPKPAQQFPVQPPKPGQLPSKPAPKLLFKLNKPISPKVPEQKPLPFKVNKPLSPVPDVIVVGESPVKLPVKLPVVPLQFKKYYSGILPVKVPLKSPVRIPKPPVAKPPVGHVDLLPVFNPAKVQKKKKARIVREAKPPKFVEPRVYAKTLMNAQEVLEQLPPLRALKEQEYQGVDALRIIRHVFGRHVYYLTPKLARSLRLKPGDKFVGLFGEDWRLAVDAQSPDAFPEIGGEERNDAITINLFQGYVNNSQDFKLYDLTRGYNKTYTGEDDSMVVNGQLAYDCYNEADIVGNRAVKRKSYGTGEECEQILVFLKDKNLKKKK